jgi:PAS domain S-box-containing protein
MSGFAPSINEARLAAIFESSGDAIITKDRDAIITSWNPAAEHMYGYTSDEAVGRPISMIVPEDRAGEETRILARILAGERVEHYESERVHRSGRRIRVALTVSPLRDETGEIVGASVIARDVTATHRLHEFASRLQELTAALAGEITRDGVISRLLEYAAGGLGARAGTVGLLDENRGEIVLAGSTGHSDSGLSEWQRFPVDAEVPMSIAVRSGDPVWTESPQELVTRYPALAAAEIRYDSLAVIPLAVGGSPFGAVSLSFAPAQRFDREVRTFLVTAAQQAAQALDRARLYEVERVRHQRLAFLASANEILAGSLDLDTTLRNLADLAIQEFADWCGIDLVDDEGGLRSVATAHIDPAKVKLANDVRERYPVDPDAPTGAPHVIRTGEPELYPEIPEELLVESAVDDEHLRLIRELGLKSAMVVPLQTRGRVLGALTLVASQPERRFDEDDLALAGDLARRAAMAIDNSMLFDREHEAAVTLQRSLLPESLPSIPGLEVAAHYSPAAAGIEVGGDWYDVTATSAGHAALTIGDVAGRGVKAASVMGGLAASLRAYVVDGNAPDQALRRLNELMRTAHRPQMATVFHIELDPGSGIARYIRAGHPPALIRHPTGDIERLAGQGTPPLGVFDQLEFPLHTVTVPAGGLLLLYTDGLIERSDRNFDTELDHLCGELASAPTSPRECVAYLAERFGAGSIPDDVALLAVSRA